MSLMINGAQYAVATALSVIAPITAISNAAPPSASAITLPTAGAILLLQSGWSGINDVPVRALTPAGGSFLLEGYDTTDLIRYRATEGAGGYQTASAFVNLPKIHDIQSSGGDQNFATRQYVDDPNGKQVQAPTFKSAKSRKYMLDYDPAKPHFNAMIELDRKRSVTILRETLPNGDTIYYAGYISFNKEPTTDINEFMSNELTFSMTADSIRYAYVAP